MIVNPVIQTERIRANRLKVGDSFIKFGMEYEVKKVLDGNFINYNTSASSKYCVKQAMLIGCNSQEWVELVKN